MSCVWGVQCGVGYDVLGWVLRVLMDVGDETCVFMYVYVYMYIRMCACMDIYILRLS